jgi:hypothetical protein
MLLLNLTYQQVVLSTQQLPLPESRPLSSAFCRALGKVPHSVTRSFTECRTLSKEKHSAKTSLPSAELSAKAALGKEPSAAV